MVSIISRWLQKRMPSFEVIESKLTKEEVENNKDITISLKMEILWFFILLVAFIVLSHENLYVVSIPTLLTIIITGTLIFVSIVFTRYFRILKYKICMFMIMFSLGCSALIVCEGLILMVDNLILSIILIFIALLCIKKIIFGNIMKSTKYEWILNIGSFLALLTSIWEFFFGRGNFEDFIEAIFLIIFFSVIYKSALNAFADHYKTLFYLLTYPEEFRKKFSYSVKDWYGVHSPQYKAEKES